MLTEKLQEGISGCFHCALEEFSEQFEKKEPLSPEPRCSDDRCPEEGSASPSQTCLHSEENSVPMQGQLP